MDDPVERRADLLAAVPGVLLVCALSLVGLGRSPFWLDEGFTVAATNQLGQTLTETAGNMATYYLLLTGWMTVSDSLWWIRLLSVVLAAVAVAVMGALARAVEDVSVARWTCLFAAASWMLVRYAQEARSYTLVVLLVATSWLLLQRAVQGSLSPAGSAGYVAVCVLIPLTHGMAGLAVVAQTAALLLAPGVGRRVWRLHLTGLGATLSVLAAMLAIGANDVGDWVPPLSPRHLTGFVRSFTAPHIALAVPLVVLLAVGATTAVVRARRAPSARDRFRLLLPVVAGPGQLLLLVALSVVRPSLSQRYGIGAVPGLALLLALGARDAGEAVVRRLPPRPPRALAKVGRSVVAAVVLAILLVGQISLHDRAIDDWRTAAEVVAAEGREGDALVFPWSAYALPFEVAWVDADRAAPVELLSPDRPLGATLRYSPEPTDDEIVERAVRHPRVWMVHSGTGGGRFGELTRRLEDAGFVVTRTWPLGRPVQVVLLSRSP